MTRPQNRPLVAAYLASIVAANVAVVLWGRPAALVSSWLVIPLDLTVKDVLQERWTGQQLVLRLGALVLAGSLLTVLVLGRADRVAVASAAAFLAAGAADGVVLHRLRRQGRLLRVNASNVAGAAVDSLVFQLVAFGDAPPLLVAAQASAKVVGGLLWSLLLVRLLRSPRC
jgi:uncharacterized PurR-regulated membrane protein YhhQ (DUF165 family)